MKVIRRIICFPTGFDRIAFWASRMMFIKEKVVGSDFRGSCWIKRMRMRGKVRLCKRLQNKGLLFLRKDKKKGEDEFNCLRVEIIGVEVEVRLRIKLACQYRPRTVS
jgi:hypothetical protein